MKNQKTQENKKFYAIQQYGKTADVYIFDDISEYSWTGYDGQVHNVSPITFKSEIEALDVDVINVHINCYGGSVSAGWAIYSVLRNHKAQIKSFADGFVCSAALYPFLAGDQRIASSVSAFYLHEVSTGAWGYAKDLRAAAEEAEKLTEIGINAFVERAGMKRETVEELMENETWLSPEEALSYNIATEVVSSDNDSASQSALSDIMNKLFMKGKEPEEKLPEPIAVPEEKVPETIEQEQPEEKLPDEPQPENGLMKALAGIFNA